MHCFFILPSQPSKFGARKNENNFIQVSEAYIYTLKRRCHLLAKCKSFADAFLNLTCGMYAGSLIMQLNVLNV